jgi:integrase
MPKSARKINYLFHKNGSPNWYVRFQRGGKDVIESLRTADRLEAEAIAATRIGEHKVALLAARPRIEATWLHELEPGREHAGPDGSRIVATDKELIHIGHNGAIIRTEPNGGPAFQISRLDGRLGVPSSGKMIEIAEDTRPAVPRKRADDAILQTYIEEANVTGYPEREARAMWSLFRTLTNGVPISETTRDDGRKLVEHLKSSGAKPATIRKKLMWLKAACNLAVDDQKLKFNPFAGVGPKSDELGIETRLPLGDGDMRECKRNLSKLSEADQLLFRLLATTGVRLGEAFQIDGEEPRENGCRFVITGKKTPQSRRRVPFPADLLAHLPKTIKGPLFKGDAAAASKRLNRFLREIGIVDSRKVIHSLRHRAQDRLRAAECPQDVRWALLGHEKKTVAAGYGEGFPVKVLRKWVDKIGF